MEVTVHHCHANGCEAEAHAEIPFCRVHFGMLPEPHRKKLWAGRPRGRCGVCDADGDRAPDWNEMANLGIAILACVEEPAYEPRPETTDAQGFCWTAGIGQAEKTVKTAKAVIRKFGITAQLPY